MCVCVGVCVWVCVCVGVCTCVKEGGREGERDGGREGVVGERRRRERGREMCIWFKVSTVIGITSGSS